MNRHIVCFGEVLWDVFPTHKKLGGAPLNVALRAASLGAKVTMISQVGNDEDGAEILRIVRESDLAPETISLCSAYPTGIVKVMVNQKGNASYDILYPSAWDNIAISDTMKEAVAGADAFIFGSLICRDEVSRGTLLELLQHAPYKVFDVNLRAPYYTIDVLNELMGKADFIKFNDTELIEICQLNHSPYHSLEQNILFVAEQTNTSKICVTKGRHGAVLYYDGQFYYNSGFFVKVVDTVGSGDSFLATLIDKLLQKTDPLQAITYACAMGALVATFEGGNPQITEDRLEAFIHPSYSRSS